MKCPKCQSTQIGNNGHLWAKPNYQYQVCGCESIGDLRFEIYCTDESGRLNKNLIFLPLQDSCQKATIRFWVRSIDLRFEILDLRLTPRINAGAWGFYILDFGLIPRINPGACTTFEIRLSKRLRWLYQMLLMCQSIWDLRFEILDWSIDPTDKFGGQVSSGTGFLFLHGWIRGLVSWVLSVNRF
jgi:hypothetical protein